MEYKYRIVKSNLAKKKPFGIQYSWREDEWSKLHDSTIWMANHKTNNWFKQMFVNTNNQYETLDKALEAVSMLKRYDEYLDNVTIESFKVVG